MKKRKSYQKPQIKSEKAFEQSALQCTMNTLNNLSIPMGCCKRKAPGPRVAYS